MSGEAKPIRTIADCGDGLVEAERFWGSQSGVPEGDRLDVLATLIDAYEAEHYPMEPPDPVEAIEFRMDQQGLNRVGRVPTGRASPRASGRETPGQSSRR
ncbi:MAG: type II toxin-antitoxin system HigA family antitoxin [Hyphomicrobiales bacterium]